MRTLQGTASLRPAYIAEIMLQTVANDAGDLTFVQGRCRCGIGRIEQFKRECRWEDDLGEQVPILDAHHRRSLSKSGWQKFTQMNDGLEHGPSNCALHKAHQCDIVQAM